LLALSGSASFWWISCSQSGEFAGMVWGIELQFERTILSMIKFPAAKLVMSPDITDDYSNLNKDYFQPSRKNLFHWEF
jgi:hypothetical protein